MLEGEYAGHQPFFSVRQVSDRFGVGLRLARNALNILAREGLVYSRERQGTFVTCQGQPASRGAARLECVNIIERAEGTAPPFNWTAYCASYTEFLAARGVPMRRTSLPPDEARWDDVLSPDAAPERQGCVLVNIIQPAFLSWLGRKGTPFVSQYFRQYSMAGLPEHRGVIVNKIGGAFRAANYLLALGHRRIGFIGSVPDDPWGPHADTLNVYDGLLAALRTAGLDVCPEFFDSAWPSNESDHMRLAREYLGRPVLPTAVLTQTDVYALALLRAAREQGLRVPDDLSVVGFDGLEQAAWADPPLTTVAVPRRILGGEALRLLFDAVEGRASPSERRVLECQLTVRKSAGPAPACSG